ncbi:MAG: T9SS type A sorting domain-containing protein [Rhodothermaceae bacterium]|nr:T9SS type A sorting domain-containing protein [Rhodothermaceae bacterium]MYF64044.1 T9SS type A sorting domain-containing protein [Rhodothermaceae bacterium]MYI84987.1 T9SS type A sorting domain-containing protein [Rhodothermaceae bacterium]
MKRLITLLVALWVPLAYGQDFSNRDDFINQPRFNGWSSVIDEYRVTHVVLSPNSKHIAIHKEIKEFINGQYVFNRIHVWTLRDRTDGTAGPSGQAGELFYTEGPVYASAFSAESHFVNTNLAVALEGRIFLYKVGLDSDNRLQIFNRHLEIRTREWGYYLLTYSTDGTKLMGFGLNAYGQDFTLQKFSVWSTETGEELGSWLSEPIRSGRDMEPVFTELSPDHTHIAIALREQYREYGELHIYETSSGNRVCVNTKMGQIRAIDYSPSGNKIIAATQDNDEYYNYDGLRLVNPHTCEDESFYEYSEDESAVLSSVRFLDEDRAVTGIDYRTNSLFGPLPNIHIWDLTSGQITESLAHPDRGFSRNATISGLAVAHQLNLFISVGDVYPVAVGGYYPSYLVFWKKDLSSRTDIEDEFVNVPDIGGLQAYPNPVTDRVRFTQTGQVTLYDIMGREVIPLTTVGQDGLSVDHLPTGMYLYRFVSELREEQHTGRIMKY